MKEHVKLGLTVFGLCWLFVPFFYIIFALIPTLPSLFWQLLVLSLTIGIAVPVYGGVLNFFFGVHKTLEDAS